MNKKRKLKIIVTIVFVSVYVIYHFYGVEINKFLSSYAFPNSYQTSNIPDYNGEKEIYINNNVPDFDKSDLTTDTFEIYYDLDKYGRATGAYANLHYTMMPKKKREEISMVKPTGWHLIKYDIIKDKYLYNRCHLIAYMFTGQNANEKNLITCTRELNATTMLKYEQEISNYLKKTKNHVLYRVTPIYDGNNLLSKGVQIEALSVEDQGLGIKYNIFLYNVQEGISINYKNGESELILQN